MTTLTWVLEGTIFEDQHRQLATAAKALGQQVLNWQDDWLLTGLPTIAGYAVFHGSLENAAALAQSNWQPGAFCNVEKFSCATWYQECKQWLVHERWAQTTVADLVANPALWAAKVGANDQIFVRPDSPLKPFSGRVLSIAEVSLRTLDHGFYYDDVELPIIVAPVKQMGAEWRFVVANQTVIASSAYEANARMAQAAAIPTLAHDLACEIAQVIPSPDLIYVLDIGIANDELRLLELNPFSGADLYNCDRTAIAAAVEMLVKR